MSLRTALGLTAVLLAAVGPAALAKPAQVAPAAQPFRLGRFQLAALRDADNVVSNDGKTFGVGVPTSQVGEVLAKAGAPTDTVALSVDALLVKAPGRVMLFDTGLGPGVHGVLLASLAQAGVSPEQVTDVFITHTHGDHVGGLATADGRLAFPRAVVHMSAREWAWMRGKTPPSPLAALIAPQVQTFEPGAVVAPGVTSVALYGHTPGHTGYQIESDGQRLFDVGDISHSAIVSLARPDWVIQYDNDPALGRSERQDVLKSLAASHERVFAPHFPFPGVGRVVAAADGYRWAPDLPAAP